MSSETLIAHLELRAKGNPAAVPQAKALEDFREALGLTQLEFASLLRVHPGNYQEVVRGEHSLSLPAIRRAYAIGVPADSLLQMPRAE